mmetsp:Transcript_10383/g.14175  ORF Transcript_10383/g.14175 Transcript_10383/m.14175 type:complete len:129 (-) Transcript_10383:106-492(-)
MLELFNKMNLNTEQTGVFTLNKKSLFMLVAKMNGMMVDIINKIGFLKRFDPAWNYAHYGEMWEGIRTDFELDQRFESLDYKLVLITTQAKFYLESMQTRKTDTLEWIIIILILAEVSLCMMDMATKVG